MWNHLNNAGSDFGSGEKTVGRDIKQQFTMGMVLTKKRKCPTVWAAGGGADSPRHLLLNHYRNGLKAAGLQEPGEYRGGDIVGQIGTGFYCKVWELVK